ncbi:bifunctional diguanylate cyclase/phosphodiesterase [Planomicrobium sp. YIM 101495]|uniref:putative bifunctional diguanylate cyclase/phosphodiesterase n=1 Tax=Planomicrobium sp. YIM 101495 TaxID=2665160 RepID=UPI001E5D297B|nr:EAL domain-containing protein [Planomicrobium sp. YIM 101495]
MDSTNVSYVIWLVAYFFFLAALISKIRELSSGFSGQSFIFNITVFMITVGAISFHYLIQPVLELSGESWLVTLTTLIYPVVDLTILFVLTILYYLIQKHKQQEILLLCLTGFSLQIAADFIFAYLSFEETYRVGHSVDLIWMLATLFIGFAAYYAKPGMGSPGWLVKDSVRDKVALFPYVSILTLFVLVIYSNQWELNALTAGLSAAFLLVLGNQLQVLRKNQQLVGQYRHLAYHDPLTGLRNRGSFVKEVRRLLNDYPSSKTALLLIDLDQFKVVNDTLGHHSGDQVLIGTARRLESVIDKKMLLFRLSGDEFTIVITNATNEKCVEVAEKLLDLFQESLSIGEYEVNVTPSIGISTSPAHGRTLEELMKNADAAMYLSKENGKNDYKFFNAELSRIKARKMTIETELKKAIQKNQLQLHYQPKVNLYNNEVIGMEALLRWNHPELGSVSPAEFIPVAEETGQIVSIGEWALREACRQNKQWQQMGLPSLTVSVNVSVLQFKNHKFLDSVRKIVDETTLDTEYLELEITESILQNIKESQEILGALREMGIKISIDDFGTGYSSLHMLQKLPIDTLKIDKVFVDELDADVMDPMVKTIIDLGLNLNLTIVAEGVEYENQRKLLVEQGCTIGQGYFFSKPIAPAEFEAFIQSRPWEGKGSTGF